MPKVSKVSKTVVSQSPSGQKAKTRPESLKVVDEEGMGCPDLPGPRSRVTMDRTGP